MLTSTALAGVRCTCVRCTCLRCKAQCGRCITPALRSLVSCTCPARTNAALEYAELEYAALVRAVLACAALSCLLQVCASCVCLRRAGVELRLHMHIHCTGVCVTLATAALGWAVHLRALHMLCYGSVRCKMPALRSCEMHSPTHTQRSSTLHSCALHLPAQRSGA